MLIDTLDGNEDAVASALENIHDENCSILNYNNENSLSCVISLAYYCAKDSYIIKKEYQSGKEYVDLVFIPRKHCTTPAIVVELKYDSTVVTAIEQIKESGIVEGLKEYSEQIILVGISYNKELTDKNYKKHSCRIEKSHSNKRRHIMKIHFKDGDDAIAFVAACNEFDDAIDLVCGKTVIDAKSIMGVMSLDLNKEYEIVYKCYDDVDDYRDFCNRVSDKFEITGIEEHE